jgi:hypothetical protein
MGPTATPIKVMHQIAAMRIAGDERPRAILVNCCILTFGIEVENPWLCSKLGKP